MLFQSPYDWRLDWEKALERQGFCDIASPIQEVLMNKIFTLAFLVGFSSVGSASDYCAGTARSAALGVARASANINERQTNIETEPLEKGVIYKVTIGESQYTVTINTSWPEEGICTVTSVVRL